VGTDRAALEQQELIVNTTPPFPISPLEAVREGMAVVDEHGHPLGKVARVRLGYPEATEPARDDAPSPADLRVGIILAPLENPGGTTSFGAATPFARGGVEHDPDIPDELRLELLRTGYIELDTSGLRGPARYVHGDQIAEVSGDTVRLRPLPIPHH
jgi:hypothetical protein